MVDTQQGSFPVILTDAAKQHIVKELHKSDATYFVLSVKDSGCNGFKYDFSLEQSLPDAVLSLSLDDNTVFAVKNAAVKFIAGTHIDYTVYENSLGLKKLIFTNPNVSGECGCGESFSVEK